MTNMSESLKSFIEENINLIDENNWESLFQEAIQWLEDEDLSKLLDIVENVLHGEINAVGNFDRIIPLSNGSDNQFDAIYGPNHSKQVILNKPISNQEIADILADNSIDNAYLQSDVLPNKDQEFATYQHEKLTFYLDEYDDGEIRLMISFGYIDEYDPLYIDDTVYKYLDSFLLLDSLEIDKQINSYIDLFKHYM